MPTFRGRVVAQKAAGSPTGASGEFVVSVPPRGRPGFVTGRLEIGKLPLKVLTGFSAEYLGGDEFEAAGSNTRGQGLQQMHVSVIVRGRVSPDQTTASGTVTARVNGNDQPPWTFVGAVHGAKQPKMPPPSTGSVGAVGAGAVGSFDPGAVPTGLDEEQGFLSRVWEKTPGLAKVAAGLGAAIGGVYLWRRK